MLVFIKIYYNQYAITFVLYAANTIGSMYTLTYSGFHTSFDLSSYVFSAVPHVYSSF